MQVSLPANDLPLQNLSSMYRAWPLGGTRSTTAPCLSRNPMDKLNQLLDKPACINQSQLPMIGPPSIPPFLVPDNVRPQGGKAQAQTYPSSAHMDKFGWRISTVQPQGGSVCNFPALLICEGVLHGEFDPPVSLAPLQPQYTQVIQCLMLKNAHTGVWIYPLLILRSYTPSCRH